MMTSKILKDIYMVIRYVKEQAQYPLFCNLYNTYLEWKAPLEQFIDFPKMLEREGEVLRLGHFIEDRLDNGYKIKLDMIIEVMKLKVIKSWVTFSLKLLPVLNSKLGVSILLVDNLVKVMNDIAYPKNRIRTAI